MQQNQEVAIDFEGLNVPPPDDKPVSQPPIKDKNGRPYNLDDPEFPVVKDHKFKINYWAMPRTPIFMIKYIKEHWEYFNKTRFSGKLKEPKFELLKDVDAIRMKLRGYFAYGERILKLSPNLFNAPHEGWINRILIHEMAHQYVWDVHGPEAAAEDYKGTKGHGPLWQAAMRMAHLPPSRFDEEGNEMYFDQKEHKKHKDYVAFKDTLKEVKDEYLRVDNPRFGQMVVYTKHGGGKLIGCLVAPSRAKKGWWIIATSPTDPSYIRATANILFRPHPEDLEGKDLQGYQKQAIEVLDYAVKVVL